MPKRALHQALVDRVRNGEGRASAQLRDQAFDDGLPPPLDALLVRRPDFAAARAAGFTEDQLFELVICAVVGRSDRLYVAGLAALAEVD